MLSEGTVGPPFHKTLWASVKRQKNKTVHIYLYIEFTATDSNFPGVMNLESLEIYGIYTPPRLCSFSLIVYIHLSHRKKVFGVWRLFGNYPWHLPPNKKRYACALPAPCKVVFVINAHRLLSVIIVIVFSGRVNSLFSVVTFVTFYSDILHLSPLNWVTFL